MPEANFRSEDNFIPEANCMPEANFRSEDNYMPEANYTPGEHSWVVVP